MQKTQEPHLGGFVAGGDPNTWYPELWAWICNDLGVRSVLDVGCGEGHSTQYFASLGCEVLGIEGSTAAHEKSVIPGFHVLHDFTTGPFEPSRRFDLVWSCEFVEHVDEEYSENFLRAFKGSAKYIVMTHAAPGQDGTHHVNCQPSSYWINRMRKIGFDFDYQLTRRAREKAGHGYFIGSGLVFIARPCGVGRGPLLSLLTLEWSTRRAFTYLKKHGVLATLRRLRAPFLKG